MDSETLYPTPYPAETLFPTPYPSVESPTVTPAPSEFPTPYPSPPPTNCVSGDRGYCNDRGYCSTDGEGCVCDDMEHYWPSERCSVWHPGRDLPPDNNCIPNTVDAYCHWNGVCNSEGTACDCFDPEHYSSSDQCSTYTESDDKVVGDDEITCEDITKCNYQGYWSDSASKCICYDPLHYWPKEYCSVRHLGPQLEEGHCCTPCVTNIYCGWNGVCNEEGTACECYDSEHRLPSERCQFWHEDINDPSLPTVEDGTCPPEATSCKPGDRGYCNNHGSCNSDGSGCDCDDEMHYWSSQRCLAYHEGRELELGQFCYPNTTDYYCSWAGQCNLDGTACVCDDPEHRSTVDRCSSWSETLPPRSGDDDQFDGQCNKGDTARCNYRGYWSYSWEKCICFDSLHFWSSEDCSTEHLGPELEDGQCCLPGSSDSYCAWMGVCNDNGTACLCFDGQHRLPSERCQYWHEDITDPSLPTVEDGTCPPAALVCTPGDRSYCNNMGTCDSIGSGCDCDDTDHYWDSERCCTWHKGSDPSVGKSGSGGSSNSGNNYAYGWPYWTAILAFVGVAGLALFTIRSRRSHHKSVVPPSLPTSNRDEESGRRVEMTSQK